MSTTTGSEKKAVIGTFFSNKTAALADARAKEDKFNKNPSYTGPKVEFEVVRFDKGYLVLSKRQLEDIR